MKNTLSRFVLLSQKISRQHIQFFFALLALIALVIGAGAPVDGGGIGR